MVVGLCLLGLTTVTLQSIRGKTVFETFHKGSLVIGLHSNISLIGIADEQIVYHAECCGEGTARGDGSKRYSLGFGKPTTAHGETSIMEDIF